MGVQTGTFSQNPGVALAGMLQNEKDVDIVSYPALGNIRAGAAVELNSTSTGVQEAQGGTATRLLGVALYRASKEPGTYAQYDMVPVVRRGRVYAIYSGGTKATTISGINIAESTDGTHNQGTFTQSATSVTTGAEITAAPAGVKELADNTGSSSLCLVELNLP